ncbi:MAG: restriction endonuclease subunit S [Woeseiaceae bacterium]
MGSYKDTFHGEVEQLKNYCKSITDCHHSTPAYIQTGKLVIRNFNIKNGRMVLDKTYFTDEDNFNQRTSRAKPESEDLIITREAPMGEVCIIPEGMVCCLGQRMVLIKPDFKKVDNKYLLYSLLSEYTQIQIGKSNNTGSIVSNLRIPLLKELLIPKNELATQQKIGNILGSIDKKIELNNKINTELEAMAKLIYDYWFVQFDYPDANGKPYKTSGGKMVYNEILKRAIPDGWEVGTLLDIAIFTNGIACQKYRPDINEPYYNVIKIREMGAGFTEKSEFVSHEIPDKVVVNNGDVLFSWSATLDVKIWTGGTGGLNQHIFKVTSNNYSRTYYYFEVLQYLQHFKMIAELRKTTMGHITQDHLKQSRISIPPVKLIETLHKKIDPILNKVIKGKEENLKLAELRDWLLPMLMNGQVTVKDSFN